MTDMLSPPGIKVRYHRPAIIRDDRELVSIESHRRPKTVSLGSPSEESDRAVWQTRRRVPR